MHFLVIFFDFRTNCRIFAQNLTIMMEANKKALAVRLLKNNVREIIRQNCSHSKGVRSLAQLAEAMNISAPTLTHALNGNPRLDTIEKIAEALNVPISRLFYDMNKIEGYISINGEISHFQSKEEATAIINKTKENGISLF